MSDAHISLEDRQKIYDTLARYVWCMDTGDIEGVAATFAPDGTVKDVTGKRWDAAEGGARGFVMHFLTRPNRRGGQHHVQHVFVEKADGGGYRVTSYWVSIRWDAKGDQKSIRNMGSYVDTCVKVHGKWLIKEKMIDPWNSETAPTHGILDVLLCPMPNGTTYEMRYSWSMTDETNHRPTRCHAWCDSDRRRSQGP